jgi:regulatory protein
LKKQGSLTKQEALLKLQRYCTYQDRCHQEVRSKLLELSIYGDDLEEIMAYLVEENYLNEERFARSFARGKFKMKQWGRIKIRQQLKARQISDYCIKKGLEEILEEDYLASIHLLVSKKLNQDTSDEAKQKVAQYLIRKGYETQLVWETLNKYS